MEPKHIVVTGGSGFLGQQLLKARENREDYHHPGGYTLINIDRQPPREKIPGVTTLEADLTDPEDTKRVFGEASSLLGGIDYVFNMVARVSYTLPYKELFGPNVKSAFNIALECAERDAFLVHMSGTAAHGHVDHPIKETDPLNWIEAYGRTKAEADEEIFKTSVRDGLKAIIFRSTAPVGPGCDTAGIDAMYQMIMKQPFVMAIKGSQVTYVSTEDVARAFYYAAENQEDVWKKPKELSDLAYNLGIEKAWSDKQVGEHLVKSILGEGKKKVKEVPYALVRASSYPLHGINSIGNLFRKRRKEPDMAINLAKLVKGPHCQDPSKFKEYFTGFEFNHPTPGDALDTGVVYKFQTEWKDKEPTEHIKRMMRRKS